MPPRSDTPAGQTWARLCMVCARARVPWHGWRTNHNPVPPVLLEVSGCRCRPVCAACYASVGGWLERAPCLLCGLPCGQAGCSPLVEPGQPVVPGQPFGCPALQWRRSLASLACGAAVHRFANAAPGVVPGLGPWPSRPPLEPSLRRPSPPRRLRRPRRPPRPSRRPRRPRRGGASRSATPPPPRLPRLPALPRAAVCQVLGVSRCSE